MCVLFVAVAHGPAGGDKIADRNSFDANLFVLYLLTMLSAFLYARSRTTWVWYMWRLTIVFLAGVLLNSLAIKVQGGNIFDEQHMSIDTLLAPNNKLILQMGYILCIQGFGSFFHLVRSVAGLGHMALVWVCVGTSFMMLLVELMYDVTRWDYLARYILQLWCGAFMIRAAKQGVLDWRAAVLVAITAAGFVVPMEAFGWDEYHLDDPPEVKHHPLGPKPCDLFAFYAWGFAWGVAKDLVDASNFVRLVATYWPLAVPYLSSASVPLRVDLKSPNDPWIRLAVLSSWLTFAVLLIFFTSFSQEDFLGVSGPLNAWSLVWYCSHVLIGAMVNNSSYYLILGGTYLAAVCYGVYQTCGRNQQGEDRERQRSQQQERSAAVAPFRDGGREAWHDDARDVVPVRLS